MAEPGKRWKRKKKAEPEKGSKDDARENDKTKGSEPSDTRRKKLYG